MHRMVKLAALSTCVSVISLLTSCGHLKDATGYAQLVDYNCEPVKNTRVRVGNRELNRFLSAGHVTTDEYISD